ncbi:MAG: hypothetical protein LM567_07455 [Desulfurococcaceae archaeon]|nr:hypothetical protein [Desulfurococcaceae archaeon]
MEKFVFSVITLLLILSSTAILPVVFSSDFDSEISVLVEKAGELYSKGLNITVVLGKLNRAIALYEEGDVEDANMLLSEVNSLIGDMRALADRVYLVNMVIKVVTILVLAVIPLAVYFLLPRIYLYVWYKTRRKWILSR